ncbi:hypothetical protein HOO54_05440 [Bacillus sp. WMMC1349]|uniref:hypothetical protein n=1 Tax=Bacillus sp. WMMC1349 TaxID=2736254 RepID=UPI00155453E6|nr:hypothetical protein [Bacillus sp. WMMC1349]NPC91693.1 hypothetical protein [Bacillus sp. WMMC1349]
MSKMAQNQENGKVPSNLIPKCPECGGTMQVHVEVDQNFLKGQAWQASFQAYRNFIENANGKKLVLLELGVGARNQLIKAPFMNLTNSEENATYITFNKGRELYIPDVIADKSIGIDKGHGSRAAEYYKDYCREHDLPYDAGIYYITYYHDQDDSLGLSEIKKSSSLSERVVLLYQIFKDADALDRFRLGPDALDVNFLRTEEAHRLVAFAKDLLRKSSETNS